MFEHWENVLGHYHVHSSQLLYFFPVQMSPHLEYQETFHSEVSSLSFWEASLGSLLQLRSSYAQNLKYA